MPAKPLSGYAVTAEKPPPRQFFPDLTLEHAMPPPENAQSLFSPRSIAVIGSPERDNSMGDRILANLATGGYAGKIFPVNLKAASILGLPLLRKLEDLPEQERPLDLAVICLPLKDCAQALRECARLPAKAALLMEPGLAEQQRRNLAVERELEEISRESGVLLVGPNSLGLVVTAGKLNVSPDAGDAQSGGTAFFSQSGAFGLAMFSWAKERNVAFSTFVSLGDKRFMDESDVLAHLADDPHTKVIAGYLENIANGPRFLENAGLASRKKPVILYRPGRSPEGARAVSSHSGALAGSDMAYEAAFKQSGVIRARDMRELFAIAQAFSMQPLPKGPGVAVIANSGASGVIAADCCAASGLSLARLAPESIEQLKANLGPQAAIYNPINVTGEPSGKRIALAAQAALDDSAAHALLVCICPAPGTDMADLAREIIDLRNPQGKTIFLCLMGGEELAPARRAFSQASMPWYDLPEVAIRALEAMYRQSQWKEHPLPVEIGYRHDKARAGKVVAEALAQGIFELSDFYALQILGAYEVPCLEAQLARTSDEAAQMAKQLGGPVALKIASPHISHKTDMGGIALDIAGKDNVRSAFLEITGRARRLRKEAYIAGCHVQAMARKDAREAVIGFKRDAAFGPMVFFGLAGVHMQTFGDVACRLAPLSLEDAHDMVREVKAFPVLAGMHGKPPVKFTALEDLLLIMSQLALDFPEIQEVECNPVFADEQGAQAGGARILLSRRRSMPESDC